MLALTNNKKNVEKIKKRYDPVMKLQQNCDKSKSDEQTGNTYLKKKLKIKKKV